MTRAGRTGAGTSTSAWHAAHHEREGDRNGELATEDESRNPASYPTSCSGRTLDLRGLSRIPGYVEPRT